MIALTVYYLALVGGLATMLGAGLGWIAWGTYFVGMPLGAVALRFSQRTTRPARNFTITGPALAHAGLGGLLAAIIVLGLFALMLGAGWAQVDSHQVSVRAVVTSVLAPQLLVAAWEELAFRGAIQPIAAHRLGARRGLVAASILFGAFHLPNIFYQDVPPGLIPLTVFALTLMGLVFGWACQRDGGRLAMPVALHFGWNSACFAIEESAAYRLTGPGALVGAPAWFPESGLLGAAALVVLAGVVWRLTRPARHVPPHHGEEAHG
ncbi:MAG: type II CAAX endopeptidase family protein [Chloroflexota bacterium]